MADTPWRGTPEFEAAVKEWAEETRLPIEEARSQLDDIYRSTPEFIGPSKVVRGPTPRGWQSAVERSLRGDQRVDLGDLLDELAEEGIDIEKELADWSDDPLHTEAEYDALNKDSAARRAEGKPPRLYDYETRALFDPETNEWTGTLDELLEELDEGASSLEDQQRAARPGITAAELEARFKNIEAAAEREKLSRLVEGPKKPATPDWAKRMPDRLSDIGGASEPLPPSLGQHLKGPIERSLRESSNVRRMVTPIHPPPQAAPPAPPPVPSWTTRAAKALPKAAGAAGSAIGGALWDLGPPIGPTPMSTMGLSMVTPEVGGGSDVVTPEDIERSRKFWEDYDARQAAELSKQVRPNPNFQLPVYEPAEVGAR